MQKSRVENYNLNRELSLTNDLGHRNEIMKKATGKLNEKLNKANDNLKSKIK